MDFNYAKNSSLKLVWEIIPYKKNLFKLELFLLNSNEKEDEFFGFFERIRENFEIFIEKENKEKIKIFDNRTIECFPCEDLEYRTEIFFYRLYPKKKFLVADGWLKEVDNKAFVLHLAHFQAVLELGKKYFFQAELSILKALSFSLEEKGGEIVLKKEKLLSNVCEVSL